MGALVWVIKQGCPGFFHNYQEGIEMNQFKQENIKEPPPTITVNEALPAAPKLTAFQIHAAKAKHALQAISNNLNS
jgi:hypothetical protein